MCLSFIRQLIYTFLIRIWIHSYLNSFMWSQLIQISIHSNLISFRFQFIHFSTHICPSHSYLNLFVSQFIRISIHSYLNLILQAPPNLHPFVLEGLVRTKTFFTLLLGHTRLRRGFWITYHFHGHLHVQFQCSPISKRRLAAGQIVRVWMVGGGILCYDMLWDDRLWYNILWHVT